MDDDKIMKKSTYHFESFSSVVHLEDDTGKNEIFIKRKSEIAADFYLGQIQKLMKKSTIGDPGM